MRDVPSLVRAAACTAALLASLRPVAAELPRVASINLCTDQLVLAIAAPEQIATLSWLAADPEESMLAAAAAGYPLNFGTAEELLRHRPDVVVAGNFTAAATVELLERLEYRVVTIEPAASIEDIARNLLQVGAR
jgi:iron complex transport system substrate-binding protein